MDIKVVRLTATFLKKKNRTEIQEEWTQRVRRNFYCGHK